VETTEHIYCGIVCFRERCVAHLHHCCMQGSQSACKKDDAMSKKGDAMSEEGDATCEEGDVRGARCRRGEEDACERGGSVSE
jgi:hypothetical protein